MIGNEYERVRILREEDPFILWVLNPERSIFQMAGLLFLDVMEI